MLKVPPTILKSAFDAKNYETPELVNFLLVTW